MPRRLPLIKRFAVIYLSVYLGLIALQHGLFHFNPGPSWWNDHQNPGLSNLKHWKQQKKVPTKSKPGVLRLKSKRLMKSSVFSTKSVINSNFQRNTNKTYSFFNCSIPGRTYTLPQVPQFIIVGAQKSGTTALYEFLKEHPQIQGASVPETHFFDWHYPASQEDREAFLKMYYPSIPLDTNLTNDQWQCVLRKRYTNYFLPTLSLNHKVPRDTVFVEKTPSYLFLAETPQRILETCFWKPKIIVLLRNPIDRAVSHFRMNILVKGRTFESLLDEEIASFQSIGLSRAPSRKEFNSTAKHPGFDDLPVLTKEQQKKLHWKHYRKIFTTNYLQRGMYILQLEHWLEYFPLHESLHVIQYERFLQDPRSVYQEVLQFMDLPPFDPPSNYDTQHNVAKYALKNPLSEHTTQYLKAFFRPYNRLLSELLGPEWDEVVWSNSNGS